MRAFGGKSFHQMLFFLNDFLNKMTTTTKKTLFSVATMAVLTLAGCSGNDYASESTGQERVTDTQGLTAFGTGTSSAPATRTSMGYTSGDGFKFFWEDGDAVYAIDDNGTVQRSKVLSLSNRVRLATFYLPGTYAKNIYKVYYTGTNSTVHDKVTIAAVQNQERPGSSVHLGTDGDCGVAISKQTNGHFDFNLDHKSAYLCLLPFMRNHALGQNVYLQKIEVLSKNTYIAGTYNFDDDGGLSSPVNASQTITMKVGTGNGIRLANTTPSIANNSYYVVMAPGRHSLTVRYWIYDPVTRVGGAVTKTLDTKDYSDGQVDTLHADLSVTDYPSDRYYMWDAKAGCHYWKGYEGVQPYLNEMANPNCAKLASDERFYNLDYNTNEAYRSALGTPNINELSWYVWKGRPHWDGDRMWSQFDHLYKGGMWFMKKQYIRGFNAEGYITASGYKQDYRNQIKWRAKPGEDFSPRDPNTVWIEGNSIWKVTPEQGQPGDSARYFFLPAAGYYDVGKLLFNTPEYSGAYWSSTGISEKFYEYGTVTIEHGVAFSLHFSREYVGIECDNRNYGYLVTPDWFK